MFELLFKVWYMIAILPILIFIEGNTMLVAYLKKRHIYWDFWYSLLVVLIIIFMILLVGVYL